MQLYPHLTFNGQCEAAFKFYQECLHGTITLMMTYENTPMDLQTPPDWRKKISHATFALANFMFSGSDPLPGQYQKPQGFALQFNLSDPVETERIFKTPGGKWNCSGTAAGNILGTAFRSAGRPIWHSMADQLREGGLK